MNTFHRFLVLSSAILLLVGNVGVDVFKHICSEDGTSVSFFVNTINHCGDSQESVPDCCEEEQQEEDGCCDDEVDHFKIDQKYVKATTHPQWAKIVLPITTSDHFVLVAEPLEGAQLSCIPESPPPLEISRRLAVLQSYLI